MPRTKRTRTPRAKRSHAAFAKALAALVANHSTEDADATASLASDIIYDMSGEVGIHVDHPDLVRGYVLAALARLEGTGPTDDPLRGYEQEAAERMLGHLRELSDGCTDERFSEIYDHYHPDHEKERAEYRAANPPNVEVTAGFDIPSAGILTDDIVIARQGEIPAGRLAVVKIGEDHILTQVCRIDPDHVRLGNTVDDVYSNDEVTLIGPVIEIRRKFELGENEWPEVIGEGE